MALYRVIISSLILFLYSSSCLLSNTKKKIVIGDIIHTSDPWRGDIFKSQYEYAIKSALQEHKKTYKNSDVDIITAFSEDRITGFELANKHDAIGVIGYLYSKHSVEAALFSSKYKIPYISPVSPAKEVISNFSISMALSYDDISAAFKKIRNKFNSPSVIISPHRSPFDVKYSDMFSKIFDIRKIICSDIESEIDKEISNIILSENNIINVIMAGYAFDQIRIVNFLSKKYGRNIRFISHPQWAYCTKIIEKNLVDAGSNLEIHLISDHFSPLNIGISSLPVRKEMVTTRTNFEQNIPSLLKDNDFFDIPVTSSLFDLILFALTCAEKSDDREQFISYMKNNVFNGSSGFLDIKNGKLTKDTYLLKWNKNHFIPIEKV